MWEHREDARNVFDKCINESVVSWNVMIKGYAMHGCGQEAINCFEQMQHPTKTNMSL
jgi:pentatricopeptide repeat protein